MYTNQRSPSCAWFGFNYTVLCMFWLSVSLICRLSDWLTHWFSLICWFTIPQCVGTRGLSVVVWRQQSKVHAHTASTTWLTGCCRCYWTAAEETVNIIQCNRISLHSFKIFFISYVYISAYKLYNVGLLQLFKLKPQFYVKIDVAETAVC